MRRLILASLLVLVPSVAGAQTWQWVASPTLAAPPPPQFPFGYADGVAPAPDGHAYVSGRANGAITFGTDTVPAGGFLARLDATGAPVWLQPSDWESIIASDAAGFAYVAQRMTDTVTLGDTTLAPFGGADVVVTKHAPDGSVVWARRAGGAGNDRAHAIAVYGDQLCLTGDVTGTATFDGIVFSDGTNTLRLFVACYDTDGTVQWVTGASSGSGTAYAVAIGPGGVVVSGHAPGALTIAGVELPTESDGFVAAYTPGGTPRWAYAVSSYVAWATGLGVAADGAVYVAGDFSGDQLALGPLSITASQDYTPFLARIAPDGTPEWLRGADLGFDDALVSLAVAPDGVAYLGGSFHGTATLGSYTLTAEGGFQDLFVAAFDPAGDVLWAGRAGGQGFDTVFAMAIAPSGDVLVAAQAHGQADFGAIQHTGSPVVFARLSGVTVDAEAPPTAGLLRLSALAPNPSTSVATATLHVRETGPVRVTILDALGRTVAVVRDGAAGAGTLTLDVPTARLAPGAYVLRAESGGAVAHRRFSVVR